MYIRNRNYLVQYNHSEGQRASLSKPPLNCKTTPFAGCIRQTDVHTELHLVGIGSNYTHKHKI